MTSSEILGWFLLGAVAAFVFFTIWKEAGWPAISAFVGGMVGGALLASLVLWALHLIGFIP